MILSTGFETAFMNYITTNLRFPKDEYEELKRIAFIEKRSIASIIRQATSEYKNKRLLHKKNWKNLYNSIVKSAVKIDIPVVELVKQGRKFE